MQQKFAIQGLVTSIVARNKDNTLFNVKTDGGEKYQILSTFFCPVQENDKIFIAECIIIENIGGNIKVKALVQPFANISIDQDKILEYFLKTLRGTGFGTVSANRLYDFIHKLAQDFRYGEDFADDANGVYSDKYLGDGVSAFLDFLSLQYTETYNESFPLMIGATQENKLKSGITISQAKKLLIDWHSKRAMRKLYLLGLTKGEIQSSGMDLDKLYQICLSNPYRVASIKFEKCENILASIRQTPNEAQKICGRINRFVFDHVHSKGYSCITEALIRKHFINYDTYSELLLRDYFLTRLNTNIYLDKTYRIETFVCDYVDMLIQETAYLMSSKKINYPNINTNNFYHCKTLTDEQKCAIDGALNCRISVITGGAGTGKSLVIKEITRNLDLREKSYEVCAFTGKAVSRLHQIMSNNNAVTIDRMILNIRKGVSKCPSTIIIDEGSMVTTELFYRLINSIENRLVNVIIVGDCNQLPPIGWGNLMRELINSHRIPLFYLTTNQRIITSTSSADRYILENANNLIDKNRNCRRPMTFNQGPGFYLVPGGIGVVDAIIKQLCQANYNLSDILILSPYKSYLDTLNVIVQETYLKDSYQFRQNVLTGSRLWCVGDRVMMTKNNYDIGVMNGEEGYVQSISTDGVGVVFKDTLYTFKFNSDKQEDKEETEETAKEAAKDKKGDDEEEELLTSDLIHSFAISVHKSQGSEADNVILYIPDDRDFSNFLNVNLLYTAITRTRKCIWIVSSQEVLGKISMTPLQQKTDGLGDRLYQCKNKEKEAILETLVLPPSFDTSLNNSTALTTIPTMNDYEDQDMMDDLYAMYENDF